MTKDSWRKRLDERHSKWSDAQPSMTGEKKLSRENIDSIFRRIDRKRIKR